LSLALKAAQTAAYGLPGGKMSTSQTRERDERGRFLRGNQAAVKHSGYRYLSKGKLPQLRGIRKVRKELTRIEAELKASIPQLYVKKSLLINQIVKSHGFALIFEQYCRIHGLLNPQTAKKKVLSFHPGFQTYLSLLNLQKNAINSLQLDEDKTRKILTPFEIVASEEAKGEEQRETQVNNQLT